MTLELMDADWPAFADARRQVHQAAQWPARAARANLPPAADDSHTALTWDAARGALLGPPLEGGLRLGVAVDAFSLIAVGAGVEEHGAGGGGAAGESLPLAGKADADAGEWTDALLFRHGLERASGAALPYALERVAYASADAADPARPAPYLVPPLAELARWLASADAALRALRAGLASLRPGPGAVRLWPHHFDLAVLIALEEGDPESARSVGAGLSMGDGYYAEPYAYVSPWPRPDAARLPEAPQGAQWHTRDFVALVATADALLAMGGPERALAGFFTRAVDAARRVLGG